MRKGLQAGFGRLIGTPLLDELRARGVEVIRDDMQGVQSAYDLGVLLSEILSAALRPLAILCPYQASWLPVGGGMDIEILNEPDLAGMDPREYADQVQWVVGSIPAGYRIWAGVISNLDPDSLAWLAASVPHWPVGVQVSVHRYPPNGGRPDQPQRGFTSREQEVAALRAIIGDRPWGVSECGYHTAQQSRGHWPFRRTWHWSDDEVATFTATEVDFWEAQGATFCCGYQINDGPSDSYLDHFGWRTLAGEWKPVADTYTRTA